VIGESPGAGPLPLAVKVTVWPTTIEVGKETEAVGSDDAADAIVAVASIGVPLKPFGSSKVIELVTHGDGPDGGVHADSSLCWSG
jgi:hypothetical protein